MEGRKEAERLKGRLGYWGLWRRGALGGCMGNIWAFMGATTGPLGAKTESSRTVLSA